MHIGTEAKCAGLWTLIWKEVAQNSITRNTRFVTEGNDRADEPATHGAMLILRRDGANNGQHRCKKR